MPVLLGNESDDSILRFGNFLLKRLDHNFQWEGIFRINICNFMVTGGNNENTPIRTIQLN